MTHPGPNRPAADHHANAYANGARTMTTETSTPTSRSRRRPGAVGTFLAATLALAAILVGLLVTGAAAPQLRVAPAGGGITSSGRAYSIVTIENQGRLPVEVTDLVWRTARPRRALEVRVVRGGGNPDKPYVEPDDPKGTEPFDRATVGGGDRLYVLLLEPAVCGGEPTPRGVQDTPRVESLEIVAEPKIGPSRTFHLGDVDRLFPQELEPACVT